MGRPPHRIPGWAEPDFATVLAVVLATLEEDSAAVEALTATADPWGAGCGDDRVRDRPRLLI